MEVKEEEEIRRRIAWKGVERREGTDVSEYGKVRKIRERRREAGTGRRTASPLLSTNATQHHRHAMPCYAMPRHYTHTYTHTHTQAPTATTRATEHDHRHSHSQNSSGAHIESTPRARSSAS